MGGKREPPTGPALTTALSFPQGARIKIAWAAKQRRGATGSKAGDISAGASAGGDAHTMPAPPGAPGGVAAQYRLPGKGGKVTTKKGAAIPPPPPPPQGGNGGSGAAAAAADKPKYPSLDPSTFGARTSIA